MALGIGTAVVTAPGIAWADETGNASSDGPTSTGSDSDGPSTANGAAPAGTPASSESGTDGTGSVTTTIVTTQEGSTTTTVGGGTSGPSVTYGSSTNTGSIGGTTAEDTPPPTPSTESATTVAVTPTPTQEAVDPTTTVATPIPVTPTVEAPPAGAEDRPGVAPENTPAPSNTATGTPTAAPPDPATSGAPRVYEARVADLDTGATPLPSNTLQDNAFSALAAPELPVPTVPQPTLADTVLALPGTIISAALNLISAALAPLIGPGAPVDNPVLWGVLAFVRRQFAQSFANSTPVLAPRQTSQDLDDSQVHGTFGGSDADGDTLTYTVPSTGVGAPAHGTVSVDQASGTYTYTPAAGYVGEDYFFVTASDDTGGFHTHALGQTHTAAARVDVTVTPSTAPVNHPPVAGTDSFTTDEDTAFSGSVLGNDSDPDGNPLHTVSETKSTSAGGTVIIKNDGTFTYTPKADYNGADGFTYTVDDGTNTANGSALGTVTMTVVPVNDAPTLSVVTEPTGAANGAVKITISYGDVDDATLTTTTSVPLHGDYAASPDGPVITDLVVGTHTASSPQGATPVVAYYIPDPSRPGTETLSFTLTDAAGASVTKNVVIEVVAPPSEPENQAPTLSVVTEPTGAANGAVKVTLTYAEPDEDLVTGYISTPLHGNLYADAAGSIPVLTGVTSAPFPGTSAAITQSLYYIPDPTRPGTETLSFTLTDDSGASVTKTADVEVEAGPSDPASQPPTITVVRTDNADGTVTLAVTVADADDDAGNLFIAIRDHGTLSVGNQPLPDTVTGGDITLSNGAVTIPFTYTPDPSKPGVETLTFTVTDPSGKTASYSTQVIVGAPVLLLGNVFTPVPNIAYYDLAVIGDRIYVPTYDNKVAVIDRMTGQLIGDPVPFADGPRSGFAVTPDGKLALITTDDDEDGPQGLQILNLQTGATTFVATDDGPQWVTVNEAGTKAYVSNTFGGTVTVVDLTGATPTKLFDITGVSDPEAAVVVGNKVYVTSYSGESVLVYDANSAGAALDEYDVGGPAWAVDATPDGRLVVTTDGNIAVIDPSDDSVEILTLPDGWVGGYGIAVSPDGKRAYATVNQNDDDGSFVKSAVLVVDLTTNSFAGGPVLIGTSGTWGVRVSSDGVVYALLGDGSIAPLTEFDSTAV
ncbi:tandem-95 repeat protein [Mycobacterium yunnanensis]|uniref:Tandem-95 repeat protein n=1 Tax=Mycobacterium yunnanensis TaxID=368477 RepID=A0A9X3BUQ3_9MYCO|nr:tandem-95 repeat protein [Mycobacterium yunnanensis]MCV7422510.1 tandem-95 repeat protein [Mycobacterium yunnanensis]